LGWSSLGGEIDWGELRWRPGELVTDTKLNKIVEATREAYELGKRGDPDSPYMELHAGTGYFSENVYVQGRPVIKDGDPITVADLGNEAKSKITEAINQAQVTQELQPAWAYGSITADQNTAGLTVTLNKGGRPNVNIYYRLRGPGTINIEVSIDGTKWRLLEFITLIAPGEAVKVYMGLAYPYVRVSTDATGVDVEFEVVASR